METTFKAAYDEALKQADQMLGDMNIIMNAALRQRLTAAVHTVKEHIAAAEKLGAQAQARAAYEAEMEKRIAALEQTLTMVTAVAKKQALAERLAQVQSSINQMTSLAGTMQRMQQNNRGRRTYR